MPTTRRTASVAAKSKPAPAAVPAPVPEEAHGKREKLKLVRDGFTIPQAEYAVIDDLKRRAGMGGHLAKKSEILRAGIKALAAMNDAALLAALAAVPALPTGRPKGKKASVEPESAPSGEAKPRRKGR